MSGVGNPQIHAHRKWPKKGLYNSEELIASFGKS